MHEHSTTIKSPAGRPAGRPAERHTPETPLRAYGVLACVIVPLYTLLFAARGGLLSSNLSKTGNLPGNQIRFILWGVICACCFFIFANRLHELAALRSTAARAMMRTASVLLVLTALIPCLPEQYPLCAQLHDTTAKSAVALSVASTLLLSIKLKHANAHAGRRAIMLWVWHFALCLYLLLRTGASGLTESMFIITTAFQLFGVMRWACAREPEKVAAAGAHAA